MAIKEQEIDFVNTKFKEVEGWCWDEAAYLTLWLMNAQTIFGYDSGIVEIGVFKGKYLSLLYQRAMHTGQPVVGIDTFQWSPREDVISTFVRLFGSIERLSLVTEDSSRLDSPRVIQMLGGRQASFISVDGDHSASAVRGDLILSTGILGSGGIVAVDDFLNPKAIGVSEGFYRFFLETREPSLRPFAYCANKLFCADRSSGDMYRDSIWELVDKMPHLSFVQEFKRQLSVGRAYVEQELLGSKVLIF